MSQSTRLPVLSVVSESLMKGILELEARQAQRHLEKCLKFASFMKRLRSKMSNRLVVATFSW